MNEVLLAIIAVAITFCTISLTTIAFIMFRVFIGYKDYLSEMIEWYLDEFMPKAMTKILDNLFKDDEKDEDQEQIEDEEAE